MRTKYERDGPKNPPKHYGLTFAGKEKGQGGTRFLGFLGHFTVCHEVESFFGNSLKNIEKF